ncbi:hypothetical protein [Prevotella sp. khp7]|uniref:hypothetical protein n=1 Tax=Prevotella sp. khp7 TaxID=1761885 RepID=UPI00115F9C02|nr:hypothetical protein [Prevotella sp. khp7]
MYIDTRLGRLIAEQSAVQCVPPVSCGLVSICLSDASRIVIIRGVYSGACSVGNPDMLANGLPVLIRGETLTE